MDICKHIRKKRHQQGLSQESMAAQLNLSQSTYHRLENGTVKMTIDTLMQIVQVLQIDVCQLLHEECAGSLQLQNHLSPATIQMEAALRECQLLRQLLDSKEQHIQLLQQLLLAREEALGKQPAPDWDAAGSRMDASYNPHSCKPSAEYLSGQAHLDILYQNEYLTVCYDARHGWLYKSWQYQLTLKDIQRGCRIVAHLFQGIDSCRILADTRLVEGDWTFARDWISQEWFPQMAKAGLQYFACIYSSDPASRISTDEAIKTGNGTTIRQAFDQVGQARQWLMENNGCLT